MEVDAMVGQEASAGWGVKVRRAGSFGVLVAAAMALMATSKGPCKKDSGCRKGWVCVQGECVPQEGKARLQDAGGGGGGEREAAPAEGGVGGSVKGGVSNGPGEGVPGNGGPSGGENGGDGGW